MFDQRYKVLASQLLKGSLGLTKGKKLLIEATDIPSDFLVVLLKEARDLGVVVLLQTYNSRVQREYIAGTNKAHASFHNKIELSRMKQMDAYIAIRGAENQLETGDIPGNIREEYLKAIRPTTNYRVNKTKWVVLRWPTAGAAQAASMSTEAFENFFFEVCCFDYSRMEKAMAPLKKLMDKTDKVHIKDDRTDLRFSIKGIGSVSCFGSHNIPDGEVFSCPQKYSVEGEILYNAPSIYQGKNFQDVYFKFSKGKIIDARANDTKSLNQILNTDQGARYIGEFALGVNPFIKEPTGDILFDEKIGGSFHFTPGMAYEVGGNGNKSSVHWDLVSIQRADYGGGEIWFDGKLIRKDGLFVPKDLRALNPDKLINS